MAHRGGIAQLVERCFCTADVSGSNPLISTKRKNLMKIEGFKIIKKSSEQELTTDTLVFRSDEGRGYQRNVSGNWKQVLIRKYPNKETSRTTSWIHKEERANLVNWNILVTRGKESKSDSRSSGERNGNSLNPIHLYLLGGCGATKKKVIVLDEAVGILHRRWWKSRNQKYRPFMFYPK